MKITTKLQFQLLFLFLIFSLQIVAQNPWPEKGTRWWYFGGDVITGPQLTFLEAEGSEVFKGRNSQRIVRNIIDYKGNSKQAGVFYAYEENDSIFFYSEVWQEYILTFDNTAKAGEKLIIKNPTTNTGPNALLVVVAPGAQKIGKKEGLSAYQKAFIEQYFILPLSMDESSALVYSETIAKPGDAFTPFYNYEDWSAYEWAKDIDDVSPINNVLAFSGAVFGRIWINFAMEFENLDFKITNGVGKQIARGRLFSPDQEIIVNNLRPGRYYLHFPGSNIKAMKFDVW